MSERTVERGRARTHHGGAKVAADKSSSEPVPPCHVGTKKSHARKTQIAHLVLAPVNARLDRAPVADNGIVLMILRLRLEDEQRNAMVVYGYGCHYSSAAVMVATRSRRSAASSAAAPRCCAPRWRNFEGGSIMK
eukprot:scaffold44918_cov63-Phaeocystis_antarctica.AAC.1